MPCLTHSQLQLQSELDSDVVAAVPETKQMSHAFVSRKPKALNSFEKLESTGINISYHCIGCRDCTKCKNGALIENISVQEEVEQTLINESVTVDVDLKNRACTAKLSFLMNPDTRLVSNLNSAHKIYRSQVHRLSMSTQDRTDIIESEGKLQELGFVDYLENLSESDKNSILNSPVKYFIPWHMVWSKSVSTPIRPVFNASHKTPRGCSLNEILVKGINSMNNLVQILIRWTIRTWAFHTDVRKMYNAILLDKSHWRFHLYLWQEHLDPKIEPMIKVIKTLIYGVKPSGNQAERAIRQIAEKNRDEYPIAYDIVQNDIYVDDCISGTTCEGEGVLATEELMLCLEKGGFTLKGFSCSGKDPNVKLSADNKSISVGGGGGGGGDDDDEVVPERRCHYVQFW